MRRVFGYLKPYKWLVVVTLALSFFFAGLEVYTNIFVEDFIDNALKNKDLNALIFITIQYVVVSTSREVAEYFFDLFSGKTTGNFVRDLRRDFYGKLISLPYKYFIGHDKSSIISKFVNDSERAREALEQVFHASYHGIAMVLFIIIMFTKHFMLTLSFFLIVPGMLVIIKMFARKIIFTGKRIQEQLAIFVMTLRDFLGGIRVIKSFGAEKFEINKFERDNNEYFDRHMANVQVRAGFEFVEGWLMFLSIAAVGFYGGYEVIQGRLSEGAFAFFFLALGEVHENISDFIEIIGKVQTYLYAADRVFSVIDETSAIVDEKDKIRLPHIKGNISFSDVYFRYDGADEYALKNVDFNVAAGSVVAIVGKSGSGKSTIANLLLHLYDPTDGKVSIDGKDIEDICSQDLRSQVSIVPQDTFLFYDTIANNIAYGTDKVIDSDIELAAEKAYVMEFASRLPEGLDTVVGEDGSNLSGGQRQRIAIARVLLRNPRVLILDEATSALDVHSEKLVIDAIDQAMKDRTTFIITHKISMAMHADRIIVMDEGSIRETGSHDELMGLDGIYSHFYKQQVQEKT